MYALTPPPSWSTLSTDGYRSKPDREWFYHFRDGGYASILHLDIQVETPAERDLSSGRFLERYMCQERKLPTAFVCSAICKTIRAPTSFKFN
ncbi:hypothetical protein [Mesorhizobium shangrilense]|uniref:Uncharacterized protein n=1 Tax=Mesorhizobium shangrilense TaxID=460060 RepID=A0ABV2D835_9HYPH